jgi:hypothetical protein
LHRGGRGSLRAFRRDYVFTAEQFSAGLEVGHVELRGGTIRSPANDEDDGGGDDSNNSFDKIMSAK